MSAMNSSDTVQQDKLFVTVKGNTIDITGLEGSALCGRLCSIARENDIGKFDIFDGDNEEREEEDLTDGDFVGNLRMEKHNESN